MADNGHFDHTGTDGSSFVDRIKATNYDGGPMGENIALGYRTEAAVMDGWINSSGHYKNIMKSSATDVGVARVGNYWTQVFGRGDRTANVPIANQ
jgi:uncharacterized protein YkwD